MGWFNADDQLHGHRKPRQAGLPAMGMWVLAGTLCSGTKTDGAVPQWYIDSWGDEGREAAEQLVAARLWTKTKDGYRFRAWDEYQRTKEQVENDQARNRERQRKWREKQRQQALETTKP